MRVLFAGLMLSLMACGSSTDLAKPKPDPYVTVSVRNQLDTTTRPGRAQWHVYLLLTGPYVGQNGISPQGAISLEDIRLHHDKLCIVIAADSVGQRFISPIAVADTTTSSLTADATANSIVSNWYAGDHNLPAGWMALFVPPTDAWVSDQYNAGHGLVPSDPIKWGFDWTGAGITSFYERTDAEPVCNVYR